MQEIIIDKNFRPAHQFNCLLHQTRWSCDSRQLAVARRSLDMVEPYPIHGRLLVLVSEGLKVVMR